MSGVFFFFKVIFLLSRFESLSHSLFYLSMWGCQFCSIGRLRRWRIRERSLDIEGTGEIKYPRRT